MYYNKNEITLLYNKNRELDRKTLAMAHTLRKHINKQEINTVHVSETLFYFLLDKLGCDPKEIIDKSQPYYQNELKDMDLDKEAWFEIIMHHPELLRAPIAVYHDKAIICKASNDILYLV